MIPASVRRIVDRLDGHPVGVYDAMWTLLSWNPLWAALFGDPSGLDERARNTLWRHFAAARRPGPAEPDEVRAFENSMVADLRATTGRYPHDPDLAALLRRPAPRRPRSRRCGTASSSPSTSSPARPSVHPEVGDIDIDCDVLATQRSDLRVVVFTPRPGTDARSKLDLLAALGTQTLGAGT